LRSLQRSFIGVSRRGAAALPAEESTRSPKRFFNPSDKYAIGVDARKKGEVHAFTQISRERVENVSDKLREGDHVKVKVLEVDKQGRIRLSMKAIEEEPAA